MERWIKMGNLLKKIRGELMDKKDYDSVKVLDEIRNIMDSKCANHLQEKFDPNIFY